MCYCWSKHHICIQMASHNCERKGFVLPWCSSFFLTHRSFSTLLPCVTKRVTTNKSSWWKFIETQGIRDCFLESQRLQTWYDNQLGESVGWAQAQAWCPENISSFHSADIQWLPSSSRLVVRMRTLLWTLKLCSIAFSDMQNRICSWWVEVSSTWCPIQGLNSDCFQLSKVVICAILGCLPSNNFLWILQEICFFFENTQESCVSLY